MSRQVGVYEWRRVECSNHCDKFFVGVGKFHQWGVDYEEFSTGPGTFSTAIVEMPDGTVMNVRADMIVFIN